MEWDQISRLADNYKGPHRARPWSRLQQRKDTNHVKPASRCQAAQTCGAVTTDHRRPRAQLRERGQRRLSGGHRLQDGNAAPKTRLALGRRFRAARFSPNADCSSAVCLPTGSSRAIETQKRGDDVEVRCRRPRRDLLPWDRRCHRTQPPDRPGEARCARGRAAKATGQEGLGSEEEDHVQDL
ncbi:hypothetical protein GN956_G14343 [Arapaima gigas]